MADIFTKQKRSEVMSQIRSFGNKATEMRLIRILRKAKISGWRRHRPMFGTPDFIFQKEKLAIFVDGCFWHGCPNCYRQPKTRKAYWEKKIQHNRQRDRKVSRVLRQKGWRVVRIWECNLRKHPNRCVGRIANLVTRTLA